MSDLDKLFGDFDSRKQDEIDAKQAQASKERQLRAETIDILTTVALPTLRELSEAIAAKGHRAEVRERFENYTYPSVALVFTPVSSTGSRHPYAESILTFEHTEGGNIKINQKVRSSNGREMSDYATNGELGLATLSQEKVRARALQFIEASLKAN